MVQMIADFEQRRIDEMDIVNQSLAKMFKDVQTFVDEKIDGADYEKQLFDIKVIIEDV